MEIIVGTQLSNVAAQTTLDIQGIVTSMQASGMSNSAIKDTLMADLTGGGRLFGNYRNQVKNTVKTGIGMAGSNASRSTFTKAGVEQFQWVSVGDGKVCPDCEPRHGEVEDLKYWELIGLPQSGFSVCQQNCRCQLVPESYKGENLDKPLVREKKKPLSVTDPKMAGKHKTVVDAQKWAEKNVASNKADFSKLTSVRMANGINSELLDMKDKGYGIYDEIKPFSHRKFKKGIMASTNRTFYYGDVANNYDKFTDIIKKNQKSGFFIKSGNPIKQAIDHEFGHRLTTFHLSHSKGRNRALQRSLSNLKSKYSRGLTAINKKHGVDGIWLDKIPYKLKNGQKINLSNSEKSLWKGDRDNWFISRYSSQDIDEFSAECFSMALNSDKISPIAKEFMDILIREGIIDNY